MVLFPVSYEKLTRDAAKLRQLLRTYGLRVVEMQGDGNCQFRAMASFFRSGSADHPRLRRRVVQFIADNAELFTTDVASEYGCDVPTYCAHMARDGSWGDAITLQAFGLLFELSVWLFLPDGVSKLHEERGWPNVALVRNGAHYDGATPL